ncbi:hypothetical protein CDL12_30422 [Handroanthus impetiginosus]|uniref:DUF4283 domain-containing protein n=1 Tax=Handroanthus impetiginosus TaxID=429701 RepID=A0A2G9FVK7_9LAMI|nr:hypothetical protein CDL12_30422 [Handroanthus impetiginosus]
MEAEYDVIKVTNPDLHINDGDLSLNHDSAGLFGVFNSNLQCSERDLILNPESTGINLISKKDQLSASKSEVIKADNPDLHIRDVDSKNKPDFATDLVEYPELQSTKERLEHTEVPLQKSFAEAVRGANVQQRRPNTSPTSFLDPQLPRFGRTETIDGESVAVFSAKELQALEEPLQFSLIGKFSFGRPQLSYIRNYFTAQKIGQFRVQLLNQKHILLELTNAEDYSQIWLRREIFVEGFPMQLFKWTFEGLPLHLYNTAALFTIGKLIGQPLKVDEATRLRSRMNFARLCIEVDLQKPPPEFVKIQQEDEFTSVPVVFEKMPKYCSYCKHAGHDEQDCYIKGPNPRPKRKFVRKTTEKDKGKEPMENTVDALQSQAVLRSAPAPAKVNSGTSTGGVDTNLNAQNVETNTYGEAGPSAKPSNRFTVLTEPGCDMHVEDAELRKLEQLEANSESADEQDSMFAGDRGLMLLPLCEDEPFAEDISPVAPDNSYALVPFACASPVGKPPSEANQIIHQEYHTAHVTDDPGDNRLVCSSPEQQVVQKPPPISTAQRLTRGHSQRATVTGIDTSQTRTRKDAN